MTRAPVPTTRIAPLRWLLLILLLGSGLGLYFVYGAGTDPVAEPSTADWLP